MSQIRILCPILELRLIGLESVDVLLDRAIQRAGSKQSYYNLFAILNQNRLQISASSPMVHANRFAVKEIQIPRILCDLTLFVADPCIFLLQTA
jgi:hypothetical protein